MKLGAERKKLAALGVLVVVGGYFFYSNVLSDSNEGPPQQGGAAAAKNQGIAAALDATAPVAATARGSVTRVSSRTKTSEEFHPSMKRKPEDAIDPASIDPTLRLDLLAKVQNQQVASTVSALTMICQSRK